MGEASHFTRSDLQLIYMNVVMALKLGNFDGFSVTMINASRYGLTLDRAVLTLLEGVRDAYERLACAGTSGCVLSGNLAKPLRITFVEPDPARYGLVEATLSDREQQAEQDSPDLHSSLHRVWLKPKVTKRQPPSKSLLVSVAPVEDFHDSARDTMPSGRVVRLTVSSLYTETPSSGQKASRRSKARSSKARPRRQVFQCSAVTETSIIPVREVDVEPYLVENIPTKLRTASSLAKQEKFGPVLSSYFLPGDFLKLLDPEDLDETSPSLTLVVNKTSAMLPWEMAAIRNGPDLSFFGPDFQLTRQFRTLVSDSPGVPPPLNDRLDVLVIADPADGRLRLAAAFEEGLAVARALVLAQKAWGNQLSLNLT